MELDELRGRLRAHLTHGIQDAQLDNVRLRKVAERAGISGQTVRNLLQGKVSRPHPLKLRRLASALQREEGNAKRRKGES